MPVFLITVITQLVWAQTYTLHLLSPWAGTAQGAQAHCANGGFGGGLWSCSAQAQMSPEGADWYTYAFSGSLTDWWDLTVKTCPSATDPNCNGGLTWGTKPKLVDLFREANQVWVYPLSGGGYRVSLVSPTAKIVVFKSPWGNKSFPRLVVGTDTLLMRPHTVCGWFWAGLEGVQREAPGVYFTEAHTDRTVPLNGLVDLSSVLRVQDSVFVDGFAALPAALPAIGSAGACFDSSRVVHILHPWLNDPDRGALPIYLHAGNLLGNQTVMLADSQPGWWRFAFTQAQTRTQDWSNSTLDVYSFFPAPENGRKTYADRQRLTALFPPNEFEIWLVPQGNRFKILRASPHPRVVHLFSPWTSTVPQGIVDGDAIPMSRWADHCGWYSLQIWEEPASWSVSFRQALGKEVYTQSGLGQGPPIDLDSVLRVVDTVWLVPDPYPIGPPRASRRFPGILGECPTRKLAVMLFDWAYSDPDFGNTYSGSGPICPGLVKGMVEPVLGPSGLPQKSATIPSSCTASENIPGWFVPQVISGGYTNATCYDLPLQLDHEGFWLADIAENRSKGIDGFFPLDDFVWLDPARTIPNPKREIENGHNYLYSMHVNARFTYVPGQYFEFRGDDDVWVFINNRLVVDIGGVHGPEEGAVNLDTLGLIPDSVYSFHIFYAERNCCGANFKMRTSIDLQTERSYYPIQVDAERLGLVRYEIWQILREKSLSCDFGNRGAADTVRAPSRFEISGPQFQTPQVLIAGVNFGGVIIDADYSGFTIDTAAIVRARSLAPGTYTVRFTHTLDPALNAQVSFVVPTYPLPAIAFADSLWKAIDPDTVILGEWAFVPYPVYIEASYIGVRCADCREELILQSADSLIFLDSRRQSINRIRLDSGRAVFWVMGQKAVVNASFTVSGAAVQNTLTWRKINLREPPVPVLRHAAMFDRDGDGRADSLLLAFSRPLRGKDAPDSLWWRWGNTARMLRAGEIARAVKQDSLIIFSGDSLVAELFTGNKDGTAYRGSLTVHFTYLATEGANAGTAIPFPISGSIADSVGAVVTDAQIAPGKGNVDTLMVGLSESLKPGGPATDSLIELFLWRMGVDYGAQSRALVATGRASNSRWYFLYRNNQAYLPTVGDSVRLRIGGPIADLSGNRAHRLNPKVRIAGRQRVLLETVGLVEVSPENAAATVPVVRVERVPVNLSAREVVAQQGIPGYLIRYDLSNLADLYEDVPKDQIVLEYEVHYFSNLGQFVNRYRSKVSCADSLFSGDCTRNPGNVFLGWNLRSMSGRLVGTGPYVARLKYRVLAGNRVIEQDENTQIWGVRRKK